MSGNKIAIIGAGITGLTTACELQNSGYSVHLFEKRSEPGGAIKSARHDGWLIEYGPNTLLLKDQEIKDFLEDAGMGTELAEANQEADKRYIVKNGSLEPLPSSLMTAINTPLFSIQGKLRILLEPFITRSRNRDQTVADFVERRLGKEILDYAINPFVAGIFANNPDELSLRHAFPVMDDLEKSYGSLIVGAVSKAFKKTGSNKTERKLVSFNDGLQSLPSALVGRLKHCHYNHNIKSVQFREEGWVVDTQMGKYGPYDQVVITIPLHKWTKNLLPVQSGELRALENVKYPPLSVILIGFKKEHVEHPLDGFGFLVPKNENRSVLGALFSSTLFKNRAPEDHHLLTVFVGGGRQPELAEKESEELLKIVLQDLNELIGLNGDPVFKEHVYWPHSIPGYFPGYDKVLETLADIEERNAGLYLAGNFREGISVPDCIKNGLRLSERIRLETSE